MQDAHLHLQDPRFHDVNKIISEMRTSGITRCLVNGTCPDDWQRVQDLAHGHPDLIIPSYGLHPWKVPCEQDWKPLLRDYLSEAEIPCIGECGLDRWKPGFHVAAQQEAFLFQLDLAREMNAPISIHILKAWGWFMDILRAEKARGKFSPERGFLIHSYNGSAELIPELVEAGAYFSFSGYYLNNHKMSQLKVFLRIPIERLLLETDAPDMTPPSEVITHQLLSNSLDTPLNNTSEPKSNSPINHPANLGSISEYLAAHLGIESNDLNYRFKRNFSRFFLS